MRFIIPIPLMIEIEDGQIKIGIALPDQLPEELKELMAGVASDGVAENPQQKVIRLLQTPCVN